MAGPKGSKNTPVGKEGLDYSDAESVAGGPIDNSGTISKGSGIGADYDIKGSKSIPPVVKGKGGPSKPGKTV